VREGLVEGRPHGMVAAFSEKVRPGRYQVNMGGKRRTRFRPALESHIGFVNLARFTQLEDLFLDPVVEPVLGAEIQVFQVDSHSLDHGFVL